MQVAFAFERRLSATGTMGTYLKLLLFAFGISLVKTQGLTSLTCRYESANENDICDGVYVDMIDGLPAFVKSDNSNEGFTAGGKTTTDGNVEHLTGPDGREAFDDSNPNSAVYNHYIYLESSRGSGERIFTIGPFDATSGRKRLQFYLNHFGDDRDLKYFAVDLSTDSQNLETIAGSATVIKDNSAGGDLLFDATDPNWQLIEKDLYWDSDMTDFYIVFRVVSEGIFGDWAFDRISVFNNHVCTGLAGYCIGDNAVCSSGSCQCLSDNNSNGVVYVHIAGTSGRSFACDAFECSGVGETCNGPSGNQGGFQTCVSGTCECDESGGDTLYYGVRNGNSKLNCQVIQCRVKSHCFDTSDYVFCDLRGTNTDHSDNRCECLADDSSFVYVATSNSGTRNVQCERRMCSVDSDCTENAICNESFQCVCKPTDNQGTYVTINGNGNTRSTYQCRRVECTGNGETCNGPNGNQGGFQTCQNEVCVCQDTSTTLYYGTRENANAKLNCRAIQCRVNSHCTNSGNSDFAVCDTQGTTTELDNRCECQADDSTWLYVEISGSGTKDVSCERRMCSVNNDCSGGNAICHQSSYQCVCKPTDNQGTYVPVNENENRRASYQCRRVECTDDGETCNGPNGNQGGFQTCQNEVCVCQDTSTTLYYGTRENQNAKLNCRAIQCRVNSHCTNFGNSGFVVCNTQGTTSELDNRCECQADDSTWLYVEISDSGTKDVSCERRMCSVNNDCSGGNAICHQSSYQCVCKPTDNQGTYVPVNENENRRASYQCRRVECTDDGETCNGPNGNQGGFQTCQNEVCVCQDTSTTLYYGTRENQNAKLNCRAIQCRVNSHCTNFGNSGYVVCDTQGTTSELDNRCECQADDSTWLYVEISNSGTRDVSCQRRMCSVNNDCSGGNAICHQSSYQCVCKPTDNQGTYVPINGNGNTRSTYQCRLVECTGDGETCNGPNGQQGAIQTCQNEVCVCVESGNNLYFEERNGNAKLNCRDVQCRMASHCTNYNAQNGYIVCNTDNIETDNTCECRADDDNFVYYPTSNNNQKNIVCAAVECRSTSDCINSGTSNTVCSNNQCVCKGPDSNGYYIQIAGTFARRYRCEAVECTADSHCTGPNGNNGANQVCASDNTCECKSNLFIESFTNGKLFCSPIACRVNTDCDFYNGGSGSVECVNFDCVCRANTDALVYRYLQGNGQQYQCEARECFQTSDCRGDFITCSGNQCVCREKDSAGSYIEVDNSPTNRDLTCKLIECVAHEDCTNTFTQCDFNTNFCVCQNGLYERVTDGNGNPLVPAQCIEIECRVTSDCQGNSNAGNNYVACLNKKCDCRNDFNGVGFLIRDHTTSGRLQECKAVECLEQSHCGENGADSNVQCNQVDYMCECVPGLFVERRINNQFYGLRECIAVQCLFNKDCQGQYTRCDNQYNCVCQDFTQYNYTQLSPYAECEAYECIDDSYCTGQYATCNNFIKRCHCEPPYFFPDGTTNGRSLRCFRHECLDDSDCPGNRAFCNEELFENRCQCPTNYEPVSGSSGQNLQCQLRNTCVNVQCNANAQCEFGSNGPTCVCDPGWCEDPNSTPGLNVVCKDVNECADPLNCGSTVTCTNTPGSYVCSCSEGFTLYSKKCYRDHFFGPWLNEGVCSKACGTGTQLQLRLCTPAEEGHGTPCPMPFQQRDIPCNIHSCDEGCSRNKLCNKCDSTRAYVTGQEPKMDLAFTGDVFDNRGPLAMSEGESVNSYIDKWALSEVLMKCKAAACDPTKLTDLKNEIEADEIQLNATDADYLAVQYFLRDVVDCNDNIDIEAGLWDIYDYFVDTCICIQNVRRDISSKRILIMREMERCQSRGWYASMLESIMKSW